MQQNSIWVISDFMIRWSDVIICISYIRMIFRERCHNIRTSSIHFKSICALQIIKCLGYFWCIEIYTQMIRCPRELKILNSFDEAIPRWKRIYLYDQNKMLLPSLCADAYRVNYLVTPNFSILKDTVWLQVSIRRNIAWCLGSRYSAYGCCHIYENIGAILYLITI